jgi:hypothetical protein
MRSRRAPRAAGALVVAASVAIALAPGASSSQAPSAAAIENVALVPMDRERVEPGQTVLVADGRITWIGPSADARIPDDAVRIDGRGKFLAPGLVDVHVHVTAEDLSLFVVNGVTTIREMNGSPMHLALREEIASGRRAGPTLFVASSLMAGVEQRWRHLLIENPAQAVGAVRLAAADGYDLIKVYDGLGAAAYRSLMAEAGRSGVTVGGHIPEAVGLDEVLASGQREIAHVEQIAQAVTGHDPDPSVIDETARRLAERGVWVVPTLAVIQRLTLQSTPEVQALLDAPEMAYVDASTYGWWESLRRSGGPAEPRPMAARIATFYDALVAALYRHGVPMAAGTDTPNPFTVPGFSLADEVIALERAGLTRFAALAAATRRAADLLDGGGEFGTIAVGKRADLVLLDANPLDDLRALRAPAGVLLRGSWLPRTALDDLLAAARRR